MITGSNHSNPKRKRTLLLKIALHEPLRFAVHLEKEFKRVLICQIPPNHRHPRQQKNTGARWEFGVFFTFHKIDEGSEYYHVKAPWMNTKSLKKTGGLEWFQMFLNVNREGEERVTCKGKESQFGRLPRIRCINLKRGAQRASASVCRWSRGVGGTP